MIQAMMVGFVFGLPLIALARLLLRLVVREQLRGFVSYLPIVEAMEVHDVRGNGSRLCICIGFQHSTAGRDE